MVFSKKWLQNHPQFLLHFLIHIDVLMSCRKFELIPSSNSGVMSILSFIDPPPADPAAPPGTTNTSPLPNPWGGSSGGSNSGNQRYLTQLLFIIFKDVCCC